MRPLDFFREPDVMDLLARSARCASVPVSVHYVERGGEGVRLAGAGRCAACEYVSGVPGGRAACRESREDAAKTVLARGTPGAFVCHMGFGCVAAPALPGVDARFVMTFGPYYPREEPRGLDTDALEGLQALSEEPLDEFPVPLDDIRIAPAGALPETAACTVEALARLWLAKQEPAEPEPVAEEPLPASAVHKLRMTAGNPYHANDIAAALAGDGQTQARGLVKAVLAESTAGERLRMTARRARTVALVAATLETVEQPEADFEACWASLGALLDEAQAARTDAQLTDAAVRVLRKVRRAMPRESATAHSFVELNRLVMERLPGKVLLKDIAAELGQHPTAITHWLQRKFDMSFTEYVGRIRIDMAKELLRRTHLGVGEVAKRVGIDDTGNFGRLFRRHEGMSPLEYRKRLGIKP